MFHFFLLRQDLSLNPKPICLSRVTAQGASYLSFHSVRAKYVHQHTQLPCEYLRSELRTLCLDNKQFTSLSFFFKLKVKDMSLTSLLKLD